jgi:hypothetical protein
MNPPPKKETIMKSNPIYAFFLLAFASVCLAQTPSDSASQGNLAPHPSVLGETGGPLTLHTLVLRLNNSFQAVSKARDSRGYVLDNSLLKTHSANLGALKKAIRGKRGESQVASPSQRRELKADLRALDDSFDQFLLVHESLNNTNIVVYMDVKEAFSAHDAALKRLNQLLNDMGMTS